MRSRGITANQMREMHWTTPQLVAQVRYVKWTAASRLRRAAFLGLRVYKCAEEVRLSPSFPRGHSAPGGRE